MVDAWLNCTACGHRFSASLPNCPNCKAVNGYYHSRTGTTKNLAVTTILALFIDGLGHIYLGNYKRGAIIMITAFLLGLVGSYLFGWWFLLFAIPFHFWQIFDAGKLYKRLRGQ